jgi:UDP-N-acetylmuramoylalanine--D-glutamate ligase
VAAALESLPGRAVLIMGGRDKGLRYGALAGVIGRKVSHLVLIGEARRKIAVALGGKAPYVMAHSMGEAVRAARRLARPGQCVLLSPGCASFDMYANYKERGDDFARLVREELGLGKAGEVRG